MKVLACVSLVILALGALLALRIFMVNYLGERADYERTPSQPISLAPDRAKIAGLREIRFKVASGDTIAGWFAPGNNRAAVVLVHGTGADRSGVLVESQFLAEAGFAVLAIDLPGQGASGGQTRWGPPEREAISGAVDWLIAGAGIDTNRIGGLGLSMGAYVMTQAAVLDQRLRAVVLGASPTDVVEQNWVSSARWGWLSQCAVYLALRASPQTYDMKPRDVIGKIAPRAVFLIGGEHDAAVPPYMAHQLFAAAGEPKALWIVPNALHVDYIAHATHDYPARVDQFFRHYLLDEAARDR